MHREFYIFKDNKMSQSGVLLVNLGSPASTEVSDVRAYLKEFLLDPRVIDIPALLRQLLVRGLILPKRPAESAEAYKQIWTEFGSPLIHISQQLYDAVKKQVQDPVALAMRYGQPSISQGLLDLKNQGVKAIKLMPLYPHYAMSSYETVVVKVKEEMIKLGMPIEQLSILPPFFDHKDYIQSLADCSKPSLDWDYDHILFSYHGIPERHVIKTDPSGAHCLKADNCCDTEHPAQQYCYKAQCLKTTRALATALGLSEDQYSVSFQSRLGRTPWLRPYTDFELEAFPQKGIKKLLVFCPSFVSDCLETLEEIQMRGSESFIEAGGTELRQVPCLNTHPTWINTLVKWIQDDTLFQSLHEEKLLAMTGR